MAVLFLWVSLSPAKLAAQTNLVGGFNPGFESGLLDWQGAGFANASIDAGNPGEGSQSAKLAANPSNNFNVIVNTAATIAVNSGRSYQFSAITRQNLTGGTALMGLCELDSSQTPTKYTWKTVSNSSSWHAEYVIVAPQSTTAYVRIYLWVSQSSTAGAAWWDSCRLVEVDRSHLTTAATDPFTDNANLEIDVAPLPVSTFTRSGSAISPPVLVPSVNVGTLLVGGTLSWKVVTEASGPSGASILQGASELAKTGLLAWTVDLNASAASLPAGNYLLVIAASSKDQAVTRSSIKPFTIQ